MRQSKNPFDIVAFKTKTTTDGVTVREKSDDFDRSFLFEAEWVGINLKIARKMSLIAICEYVLLSAHSVLWVMYGSG